MDDYLKDIQDALDGASLADGSPAIALIAQLALSSEASTEASDDASARLRWDEVSEGEAPGSVGLGNFDDTASYDAYTIEEESASGDAAQGKAARAEPTEEASENAAALTFEDKAKIVEQACAKACQVSKLAKELEKAALNGLSAMRLEFGQRAVERLRRQYEVAVGKRADKEMLEEAHRRRREEKSRKEAEERAREAARRRDHELALQLDQAERQAEALRREREENRRASGERRIKYCYVCRHPDVSDSRRCPRRSQHWQYR